VAVQRRALTFYRFVEIDDPTADQSVLQQEGLKLALKGTILVAKEGVNGTLIGTHEALKSMAQFLSKSYGEIPFKWSDIDPNNLGFYRYKVKLKSEIVTFGVEDLDVAKTGRHVGVEAWNELLDDPDVVVIDTRNQYEIDIGTFPGARSPETTNFREFPQWVGENLDQSSTPKVAMFCTGGIRCEKASAYLRQVGFEDVYQLEGGILKYLEDAPENDNRWQGECFVFDQRVSVDADLKQGSYSQCFACRHPLSASDLESEMFEEGVACPHCVSDQSKTRTERFRERQLQISLAKERGETHIGPKSGVESDR
jgi:UPF0176 protein